MFDNQIAKAKLIRESKELALANGELNAVTADSLFAEECRMARAMEDPYNGVFPEYTPHKAIAKTVTYQGLDGEMVMSSIADAYEFYKENLPDAMDKKERIMRIIAINTQPQFPDWSGVEGMEYTMPPKTYLGGHAPVKPKTQLGINEVITIHGHTLPVTRHIDYHYTGGNSIAKCEQMIIAKYNEDFDTSIESICHKEDQGLDLSALNPPSAMELGIFDSNQIMEQMGMV